MRYRVSYLYRNFNGVDDIRRFADAGNQIGPVCHRHTNKRYAEYSAVGFIFSEYDGDSFASMQ